MADPMKQQVQELRAAVTRAQRDHDLAARQHADAQRIHRLHAPGACTDSCSRTLHAAEEARRAAETKLDDALAELQNFEEEERERDSDADAIGPQTDYTFKEIVLKLSRWQQRATYGAVAELLHASAHWVPEWIPKPDQDNCFIVNARTGEPTGYPADAVHSQLKKYPRILRTGAELLAWLQTHKIVNR